MKTVTTNCLPPSMPKVQTCRHGAQSRHDMNMHPIEYAAEIPYHRLRGGHRMSLARGSRQPFCTMSCRSLALRLVRALGTLSDDDLCL